jgi:hypothetical protein
MVVPAGGLVDRLLDPLEGAARAQARPVSVLVVDDPDPAVAVTVAVAVMMVPAGGARRTQTQPDGGDHREQQHCSTSLHGPMPPG